MKTQEFNVGDEVKLTNRLTGVDRDRFKLQEGQVYKIARMAENGDDFFIDAPTGGERIMLRSQVELVKVVKAKLSAPPRYILRYELDSDPFELFATEKEARKRIAELAERRDLKRDSLVLYEIKNTRKVVLGTSIKFTK